MLTFAAVALAPAGIPLVDSTGVQFSWDLDQPQPNVVDGKVTFYIDPNGTRDALSGSVTDLDALRAGVRTWEIGTTRMRFTEDDTRIAGGGDGTDRVNWIGFVNGGLGPMTFAATFPTRNGTRIEDMDVLLNDRDFQWDTRTPGVSGSADIQGLMTHEWGHALGADHVPLRLSTMYAFSDRGDIHQRAIDPDDIALIGTIYPNDIYNDTTGSIHGTVDNVDANDDRAIHVVAVSVLTSEPAASTLTLPDGSYEINGLPVGGYRLIAAPTIPLKGAMNAYWTSGETNFLPSLLRTEDANPAEVITLPVTAGQVTEAPEMFVRRVNNPLEDDDSQSQATSITLGDGVCARFEASGDSDYYTFSTDPGQVISLLIHAWQLGSDADPEVTLFHESNVIVASNRDVRDEVIFARQREGEDLDARLIGLTLTDGGNYFVRVANQGFASGTDAFYALTVTAASDAPSAALTTVSAAPLRIDADGEAATTITILPRRENTSPVGEGATVTLMHDGAGEFSAVNDEGDGTYTATVTAPTQPGVDRVTVSVLTEDGMTSLIDAVTLVYLGPVDPATSWITVQPRRIAADSASQAVVQMQPRDARGEALGSGRTVAFGLSGPLPNDGLLGKTSDQGDGSYASVVTAPDNAGAATLGATVDGNDAGITTDLAYGFGLLAVLTQARDDIDIWQAMDGLSRRATRTVSAVSRTVDQALETATAAEGTTEERRTVKRTRGALARAVATIKVARGSIEDPGITDELALSIREAAQKAIDRAVATTARHNRQIDAANRALAAGDDSRAAGRLTRAAAQWVKAYSRVFRLGLATDK